MKIHFYQKYIAKIDNFNAAEIYDFLKENEVSEGDWLVSRYGDCFFAVWDDFEERIIFKSPDAILSVDEMRLEYPDLAESLKGVRPLFIPLNGKTAMIDKQKLSIIDYLDFEFGIIKEREKDSIKKFGWMDRDRPW